MNNIKISEKLKTIEFTLGQTNENYKFVDFYYNHGSAPVIEQAPLVCGSSIRRGSNYLDYSSIECLDKITVLLNSEDIFKIFNLKSKLLLEQKFEIDLIDQKKNLYVFFSNDYGDPLTKLTFVACYHNLNNN